MVWYPVLTGGCRESIPPSTGSRLQIGNKLWEDPQTVITLWESRDTGSGNIVGSISFLVPTLAAVVLSCWCVYLLKDVLHQGWTQGDRISGNHSLNLAHQTQHRSIRAGWKAAPDPCSWQITPCKWTRNNDFHKTPSQKITEENKLQKNLGFVSFSSRHSILPVSACRSCKAGN